MTIKIEITDPHLIPNEALHKLAVYLFANVNPPINFEVPREKSSSVENPFIDAAKPTPAPVENPFLKEGDTAIVKNVEGVYKTATPAVHAALAFLKEGDTAIVKGVEGVKDGVYKIATPEAHTAWHNRSNVELDSAGFPWDERINAKNKSKKADGTWRGGRGANPSKIRKVQNELRNAGFGEIALAPAPIKLTDTFEEPISSLVVPVPPIPNPVPIPPPAAEVHIGVDLVTDEPQEDKRFDNFLERVLELTRAKQITTELVVEAVQSVGLKETLELNSHPDLIPMVLNFIEKRAA